MRVGGYSQEDLQWLVFSGKSLNLSERLMQTS